MHGPFSFETRAPQAAASVAPTASSPIDADGILFGEPSGPSRYAVFDSHTCTIAYSEVTPTRIAGSVRCHGLAWLDASSVERVHDAGLPPFDMSATFEVTGDGTLPSPTPS